MTNDSIPNTTWLGGQHKEEHIIRAVPARDAKSLHGNRATLTIFDEFHAQSWDVVEALGRAATRRFPRVLYSSYAGLKSQASEDFPLWALWKRWKAGTDPRLFVSYIGGEDGWKQVPWITDRFIEGERKRYAAVPAKFTRLYLNQWASGDVGSFLTSVEIHDAIDQAHVEPSAPVVGARGGIDLGISFDTTGIVVSHVDDQQRLMVDAVRIFRGTKAAPVNLTVVEDTVIDLSNRLGVQHWTVDRWQAQLLADRLRARGLRVTLVTSDPASLDRWATRLKTWFAHRLIKIPNHPDFIEQLEGLEGEEMRRRDRVRFTATGNRHDDSVIALCLSGEAEANRIGQLRMAEMPSGCRQEQRGRHIGGECYLVGGMHLPTLDALCRECEGHRSTQTALKLYRDRTGEFLDGRMFVQAGLIQKNGWAAHRSAQTGVRRILGY